VRRRHLTPAQEFRSKTNDDGTHTVSGYAALYNVLSHELRPGVRERILPGAFDGTLTRSEDVTANINHNDRFLLGRTSSGTLKLTLDDLGLRFDVTLPETSYAKDLGALMARGDMRECSFAFTVDPKDISLEPTSETEAVESIRSIDQIFDVSCVVRGAYGQTFSVYRQLDEDQIASAVRRALAENPETQESLPADCGDVPTEAEAQTSNAIDLELAELDLIEQSIKH
jgi:HK97 family phage prohead protease